MPSRSLALLFMSLSMILMTVCFSPIAVQAQAYSISFMVVGVPAGIPTRYFVDGAFNGTIQLGENKVLYFAPGGVHTLSVDLMIGEHNGTRYLCRGNLWSFSEAGVHVFSYTAQHRLEVVTEHGTATGSNWYDEGGTAYAQLTINMTNGPEGVRHVFVRWEGDASGTGLISDAILMDRPKKAVASWKTQYILHISSDPAGVFAPVVLWLDEGSDMDYSALEATIGNTTRYVFMEWVGGFAGTDAQLSLMMDGPKSVTAKYKTQYLLTLVFAPAEIDQNPDIERLRHACSNGTWCDFGQTVKLGPVPTVFGNDTVQLRLLVWKIDGLTQQGPSLEIQISGPHIVELAYGREYYLNVTSQHGQVSGSGWYPSGQSARFSVTYEGPDFPVRHRFLGWESTPSTTIVLGEGAEGSVIVDRSYVIDAVWEDDYTLVWASLIIVLLCGALIAGIGVVALKRPGYFKGLFSSLRRAMRARKIRASDRGLIAPPMARTCPSCGASVPGFVEYCQSCGTRQIMSVGARPDLDAMDDRVYEYVVKRHGEISLSRASADLGISVDQLRESTERLKKKGRLG